MGIIDKAKDKYKKYVSDRDKDYSEKARKIIANNEARAERAGEANLEKEAYSFSKKGREEIAMRNKEFNDQMKKDLQKRKSKKKESYEKPTHKARHKHKK